jgi:hypothetical protein
MFFKVSTELAKAKKEELAKKEKINCVSLSLLHKKNRYTDVLFLTIEAAKDVAQDHANKNPRLQVTYRIKDGVLENNTFISGHNSTFSITGEKTGKSIIWDK